MYMQEPPALETKKNVPKRNQSRCWIPDPFKSHALKLRTSHGWRLVVGCGLEGGGRTGCHGQEA
jgi:hypothetical protein